MLIYDIFPPQKQKKQGKKVKAITLTFVLFLTLLIVVITFSSFFFFSQERKKVKAEEPHPPPPSPSCSSELFAGGAGTEGNPYKIADVNDLQNIRFCLNHPWHFVLINDIDASETKNWHNKQGFIPIGHDWWNRFQGTFDGNEKKISNLYIYRPDMDNVGLFGYVAMHGVIKNVGVENVNITGRNNVGGLVGNQEYGATISNSYSTGSVKGNNNVGGLIGFAMYMGEGTRVFNSFWDTQTSNTTTSAGGTGKKTEEMKNVRTYTHKDWSVGLDSPWDFVGNPYDDEGNENIWNLDKKGEINNGYPFLVKIEGKENPLFEARVTTQSATEITENSAKLNAEIDYCDYISEVEIRFKWKKNRN